MKQVDNLRQSISLEPIGEGLSHLAQDLTAGSDSSEHSPETIDLKGQAETPTQPKEIQAEAQGSPEEETEQSLSPQGSHRRRPALSWLSIVDRYIMRTFLGTYFFAIVMILAVAIVFDMNEKMDDFLRPEVPLYEIIVHYYLNFVPYYANVFSPLFVFISVIFFTSKFAEGSEIIAMLASGQSFKRLLRPYLLSAGIISLLAFALTNYVIPPGTKMRLDFENKYIRNKRTEYASAIQLELQPGQILFISNYTRSTKRAYDVAIDRFDKGDLVGRLTASSASYDTLGRWKLYDYRDRSFTQYREEVKTGVEMDTLLGIDPEDFMITAKDVETLTSPEIRDYISKQEARGVGNVQLFEIEYHKRLASVFSAFILTFIGAVLSAKKMKNGIGINIAIGLGLSFTYIFFMTITSTFAISGTLPAWLAAWLPNIVFVVIALSLWRKAPQ